MKTDTDAAPLFKVDPDIPDTSYNTEEKLKIYNGGSYTAAEIRAAFVVVAMNLEALVSGRRSLFVFV